MTVDELQAVGVAIEGDTVVGLVGAHRANQRIRRRRAHVFVDIETVWLRPDGNDLGPQFVKHRWRDVIGRAMRAVHHQPQTLEGEVIGKRALAEFDVATRGIIESSCLAELLGGHAALSFRQG